MIYAALGVGAVILLVILYLVFGPGPRRLRAYQKAMNLLDAGDWQAALEILDRLQKAGLSQTWQVRLRNAAGECHQRAVDAMLKEKRYPQALDHASEAGKLLGLEEQEQRGRVVDSMLAEVRRLYALGSGPDETADTLDMISRTEKVATGSLPEASFWKALCLVRQGDFDQGLEILQAVHEQVGKQILDLPLYMGIMMHRLGKPQEALRYLSDANRLDSSCPVVTWQMGVSLIASGGDSGLAMRALQRAMGPRGLPMWKNTPARVWVEAFPEGKSYIRRLSNRHVFNCPLLGGDLNILLRQGNLALAQAFYKQEKFQDAADLYGKLLQELPPTVLLLRGHGLALARLEQFDQAYKQLRIALDQEEPKDPFTAGYLALCAAMGKPTKDDDKPKNLVWALRLLARYPLPDNAEWAGLLTQVQAEARKHHVPLGRDDQLLLCDSLAAIQATDPRSALAYSHLAGTFPDALKPSHAWLYARAVAEHGITGPNDLDLLVHTFRHQDQARQFFAAQQWEFTEVEYAFLDRAAARVPGQFPEVLGHDYASRGEAFLLERSHTQEQAGKSDSARAAVEVLLKLAPTSIKAHDRLACLHYKGGQFDEAVQLLDNWHRLAPADHWPLIRQAIIEQERGNAQRRERVIEDALGKTQGQLRAAVAFLGAKLALRDKAPEALNGARNLLQECLREQPEHTEALWCLAAVHSAQGNREALAAMASRMNRPDIADARFHYLGAVCHLAVRQFPRVVELATLAAQEKTLASDSQFILAWAHLHLNQLDEARQAFQKVADDSSSSSAPAARAILGQLSYQRGDFDEAIRWWNTVDPALRAKWQLDEPLRQMVLLAGLTSLKDERYEKAAERFREAGKLGLRDRRLGGLLMLALVKAGQRLLYEQGTRT